MTTDDKLVLVGKVLKVLLVILVFPILVVFELSTEIDNVPKIIKH